MSTPEGAILKQVLDWLAAKRIFALRMNTAASTFSNANGKERFVCFGVPGQADILAFPWMRQTLGAGTYIVQATALMPFWLEVKAGKGKQSDMQKSFQEKVESEGHRYAVVRSIEDVMEVLK